MKTLEQEAEEHFPLLDTTIDRTGEIKEENLQILGHRRSFIAGANSNYVQAEKIKAQIEVLELHIEHPTKPGYKRHDVLDRIKLLKVQLKQLDDEANSTK